MFDKEVSLIYKTLRETDHRWHKQGVAFIPTPLDIKAVLDEAVQTLKDTDNNTVFDRGGILVIKSGKGYDIFVQVGGA